MKPKLKMIILYALTLSSLLALLGCQQSPYETHWQTVTQIQSSTSQLEIGDVIIKEEGSGFEEWFGHSALYLGNGLVLEAPNPDIGVIYNSLSNWPTDLGCIVLRYKSITPEIQNKLLEFAQISVGKPYVISFNKNENSGYSCSSLIYSAFHYATGNSLILPKSNVLIVMPYDFLYSNSFYPVTLK